MRFIYKIFAFESTDKNTTELIDDLAINLSLGAKYILYSLLCSSSITLYIYINKFVIGSDETSYWLMLSESSEFILQSIGMVVLTLSVFISLYHFWRAYSTYRKLPDEVRARIRARIKA